MPEAFNDGVRADFLERVRRIGHPHWEVIGRSRDGEWSERGVGIGGMHRSEACALGQAYRQRAVFELTDDELMLVRCDDPAVVRTRPRRT